MTTTELAELEQAIEKYDWWDRLADVVHDAASQAASSAINGGRALDFLLGYGWTVADIRKALTDAADEARAEQEQS